jgi:nitrate/nitrite transport system substrate-binding protein
VYRRSERETLSTNGLIRLFHNYLAIANQINRIELYQQGASQVNVAVPAGVMRSTRLMDGTVWDGKDPKGYEAGYEVQTL